MFGFQLCNPLVVFITFTLKDESAFFVLIRVHSVIVTLEVPDKDTGHFWLVSQLDQYLVKHLNEYFAGMRAVEIGVDKVRAYLAFRIKQVEEAGRTVSNASLNRELAALKRMLNLGVQAGKVAHVPYIKMLDENNIRTGYFEHDEFLALRGALPDYAKVPSTIAYYTGMRAGEILNLRWDQVDLFEGKILLSPEQTKNKTPRMIFLTGELLQILMMAKDIRNSNYPNCPWVCQREGEPQDRR